MPHAKIDIIHHHQSSKKHIEQEKREKNLLTKNNYGIPFTHFSRLNQNQWAKKAQHFGTKLMITTTNIT